MPQESFTNKTESTRASRNNEGYMPIVVHVKEGGQIVAYGFRSDNASP
jgi:hypothetical protein